MQLCKKNIFLQRIQNYNYNYGEKNYNYIEKNYLENNHLEFLGWNCTELLMDIRVIEKCF